MIRLTIEISDDLANCLDSMAAEQHKSMRALAVELLNSLHMRMVNSAVVLRPPFAA